MINEFSGLIVIQCTISLDHESLVLKKLLHVLHFNVNFFLNSRKKRIVIEWQDKQKSLYP